MFHNNCATVTALPSALSFTIKSYRSAKKPRIERAWRPSQMLECSLYSPEFIEVCLVGMVAWLLPVLSLHVSAEQNMATANINLAFGTKGNTLNIFL